MLLKPLLTEDPFILYNQYICCRWPVNTKSQDINSRGIAPEELRLCNIHPRLLHWIFLISLLTDWQCNVYIYDDPVCPCLIGLKKISVYHVPVISYEMILLDNIYHFNFISNLMAIGTLMVWNANISSIQGRTVQYVTVVLFSIVCKCTCYCCWCLKNFLIPKEKLKMKRQFWATLFLSSEEYSM